jgi:hypothetical protein
MLNGRPIHLERIHCDGVGIAREIQLADRVFGDLTGHAAPGASHRGDHIPVDVIDESGMEQLNYLDPGATKKKRRHARAMNRNNLFRVSHPRPLFANRYIFEVHFAKSVASQQSFDQFFID